MSTDQNTLISFDSGNRHFLERVKFERIYSCRWVSKLVRFERSVFPISGGEYSCVPILYTGQIGRSKCSIPYPLFNDDIFVDDGGTL